MAKFMDNFIEKNFEKNQTFVVENGGSVEKYFFNFDISKLSEEEILKLIKEKKYIQNYILIK